MEKGIDVSFYQNDINWKKVKEDGMDFAIIRSSYGRSSEDSNFVTNVKNALNNKIKIEGIYHFSYALSATDAIQEAEFAVKQAKKVGLSKDTIIFYDYEYDSLNYATNQGIFISAESIIEFTKAFCNTVKNKGYKCGVYLNVDYYKTKYKNGFGLPDEAVIWIADWSSNPDKEIMTKASYHQYTSRGRVNGIDGEVDMDYRLITNDGTNEEVFTFTEKQPIEIKKVTDEIVSRVIAGDYGNGDDRRKKLEKEGYDYREVQNAVNKALIPGHKAVSPAKEFDKKMTGKYYVTATALNLRYIPGVITYNNVEKILYKNDVIQCWGYFTTVDKNTWLLVQNGNYTGYVDSKFVKKIV